MALQALKRKKRYEQQLEQLQGTLTTIETQREALENANTNAAVLETMKGAADSLKKTHKDMLVYINIFCFYQLLNLLSFHSLGTLTMFTK